MDPFYAFPGQYCPGFFMQTPQPIRALVRPHKFPQVLHEEMQRPP